MQPSSFIKNNTSFVCINCGASVPAHPTSSRDHCNQCLFSVHVDINPGDRMNSCKEILEPIGIEVKKGKQRIVYKCQSCKDRVMNIVADDDDKETLVELSNNVW